MVLFVLGLAQSGPAGGPTVLNQCAPPRPGHKDDLVSAAYSNRAAVIDESITRSVRIAAATDGSRGANTVSTAIEMDAVGNETQMMLTLEFDPNALAIEGASFPNENPDITLGEGSPTGTTLAVNAAEAQAGRIIILLNFNGPLPSGAGKRVANLRFRRAGGSTHEITSLGVSEASGSRQVVNSAGEDLQVAFFSSARVEVSSKDSDGRSKGVAWHPTYGTDFVAALRASARPVSLLDLVDPERKQAFYLFDIGGIK